MTSTHAKRRRFRWRTKFFWALVVTAVIPMCVLAALAVRATRQNSVESTLQRLTGIAAAKSGRLQESMRFRESTVERIASLIASDVLELARTNVDVNALPPLNDAGETEGGEASLEERVALEARRNEATLRASRARERLRRMMTLVVGDGHDFEELLFIDLEGVVRVSTFAEHEETRAGELPYVREGRVRTFLQPIFQSPISESLTMVIATPTRDDDDGTTTGVLAARLNLEGLFAVVGDVTALGETGETVVGRRIGDEVVFTAATRADPEAALERTIDAGDVLAEPLQDAASGGSAARVAVDYRGVPVYAAWTFVEGLEWGLVVKQDVDEADAPTDSIITDALGLMVFVVLMAVIGAAMFAGTMVAPLRRLERAADQVSRGDLDIEIGIPPGDEIGDVAESFERMVAAIRYFRARASGTMEELEEDTAGDDGDASGPPADGDAP